MVEDEMVRVGPIMALPAVLKTFDINPSAVLAEFGLDESFFDDPENTLNMAMAANILRALCGPQWHPHAVLFAFSRPENAEAYRRVFGVPPRFDADRTGIVFPAQLLRAPIPSADPLLYKLMEERVRELKRTGGGDLLRQVRRMLRTMIMAPNCTVGMAADRMQMHVRTFNRELSGAGTTFLKLREEARRELACQLLENTRTAANEIAAILGYSDPASFTRASHRWTGSTPVQWRKSRRRRRSQ